MILKRISNSLLFFTLLSLTYAQVTIDGYAFLENQTDHSGIKVHFERTAPSSLLDSTYTDASGYFSITLETGGYNVTYSKEDFNNVSLIDQAFFSNTTLPEITLLVHRTLVNVPSDFPTIQSAINDVISGDTILVSIGTYTENINYNGKNIVIGSLFLTTEDENYISQTIIDGNNNGSVVSFNSSENSSAILTGFTITNGSGSGGSAGGGIYFYNSSPTVIYTSILNNSANHGGGIYCYNSSPIFENVTISNNSANYDGGGVYLYYNCNASFKNVVITGNSANSGGGFYFNQSGPILENVTISNNSAISGSGGGIYSYRGTLQLDGVSITDNSANYYGGGICFYQNYNITVMNSSIINNTASQRGGGVFSDNSSPSFTKVTISGNSANNRGGGIYLGSNSNPSFVNSIIANSIGSYGIYVETGNPTPSIVYSDIWNNEGGNFYNTGSWVGVNVTTNANGDSCDLYYNIQLDPLFINPNTRDYHLQAGSPSVDAGDPTLLLDPDGTVSDQGAYYYDQAIIPTINSVPDTIAIEDSIYNYQLLAVGIPSPTFSLLVYPEGMTIDTTGLIFWLPNNNDIGDTIVSCSAINNLGYDTQTFNLHINNINDPPSIITIGLDDAIEDQTYNFTIQANDDDVIHGDNISYSLSISPVGMAINNNTGEINWLPDNNDVGDTTITIIVTDDSSMTDSKTFSLLVRNTNDSPFIANPLQNIVVNEDPDSTVIDLNGVFDDDDILVAGDSLILNVSNDNVSIITASFESFTLTLFPISDQNGIANIIVSATDDSSASVSDTFTVTVNPINDLPIIANPIIDIEVDEDSGNTTIDLTDVFSDVDILTNGDSLSLVVTNGDTTLLTTTLNGDTLILSTIENQNGSTEIYVTATDDSSANVSDTFMVNINPINDSPVVVNPLSDIEVYEDSENTVIDLNGVFTDVDILTNEDSLSLSVTVDNSELLETTLNGLSLSLNYFPDQYGITNVIVTTTDNSSDTVSDTFSVNLNPINDTPYLSLLLPDITIDEDDFGAVIIPSLEEYFGDVDEGDILVFTGDTLDSGLDSLVIGSLNLTSLASVSNYGGREIITLKRSHMKAMKLIENDIEHVRRNNKQIRKDKPTATVPFVKFSGEKGEVYKTTRNTGSRTDSTALIVYPTENFVGDIQITIVAMDTFDASVSDTLILTIENLNDAPFVANAIADVAVDEDSEPVTLDLSGVFDDVDILNGDSLTIIAQSLATSLVTVDYDSISTLMLNFAENGEGETDIIITATDLGGLTVNDTVHVNILPVNDPPSAVTLISPDSSIVSTLLPEFHWSAAIDPDIGDSIHYELHWVMDGDDFVDSVLTDTNYAVPYAPLDDNSKFFWWIISMDRQYDLNQSEETIFWTDVTPEPPLAFNTVSPPDSAEGLPTEVEFIWNKANDPDPLDNVSYTLVLFTEWGDSNSFDFIPAYDDTTVTVTLSNDTEYQWMVEAMDEDELVTLSNNGTVNRIVVGTLSIVDELLPDVFALHQNYPNPFNPVTTLRYDLPENSFVNITIYDLLGRKVTTLVSETQDAGFKKVIWDATNDNGKPVSAGVYLYKIQARLRSTSYDGQAGKFVQTKKMVLLK